MESSSAVTTVSEREQWTVESRVFQIYNLFASIPPTSQSLMLELQRENHIEYLTRGLKQLAPSFCVLDANRPWVCYWILHSIALLGDYVDDDLENRTILFLSRCQDRNGGYGGGPGQLPHLATTYAAVNTLITLGGDKALSSINRWSRQTIQFSEANERFKWRLQKLMCLLSSRMHDQGEIDVRACYTAISVASILNILDDELTQNVGDYILSCQTYEGGISGEPGSEAHGGYTFCGLATMILINEANRLDLDALTDWAVFRQGVEGGFQGRTNKLVDGCYSFWQGGMLALLQRLPFAKPPAMSDAGEGDSDDGSQTSEGSNKNLPFHEPLIMSDIGEEGRDPCGPKTSEVSDVLSEEESAQNPQCDISSNDIGRSFIEGHVECGPLYHNIALQQYILLCSQDQEGGLRDKPGKGRDHYHSCYCLSGLSTSQYSRSKDEDSPPLPKDVLGSYSNLLEPIHPIYNVILDRYHEAHEFFYPSQ
ncbi:hypothetical protein ACFE04_010298 [Oxalis oulophora]